MARVKRAVNAHKKRRTILETASGYRGQRSRLYRKAKEQVLHSMQYAYRDRRDRKGDFRQLWITRINAAARANGLTYNRFIQGLRLAGVEVDRKILADLAVTDGPAFAAIVEVAREAVAAEGTGGGGTSRLTVAELQRPGAALATRRTPRVVASAKLRRRRDRDAARRFLAEGPQAVREALARGVVVELFGTSQALARHPDLAGAAPRTSPVAADALAALAETVAPQALVAVCDFLDVPLASALARRPRLVAVLVEIRDPGNAGTVLRTADAAGAGAVVFAGAAVDPYNGKCVRASAGSLFHVDLVRGAEPHDAVAALRGAGLRVLAADPRGPADLDRLDRLAAPTAWLFGSEAHGLPDEVAAAADERVRVPIHGRAESLNLAAAAAVCLYTSAKAMRSPDR